MLYICIYLYLEQIKSYVHVSQCVVLWAATILSVT
jgi:hypothetical protein